MPRFFADRSRWVAIVIAATVAGCGTAAPPSQTAAPTAVPTDPPTVASAGPTADAQATCVSPAEGPERLCPLDVGTYTTTFSLPGLTYAVADDGWGSIDRVTAPGNLALVPPGGTLEGALEGTSDAIVLFAPVVAPGHCTGEPSTDVPRTFDGYLGFLTSNPGLALTNVRDVSVGGLDGTVMDVAMVEGGDGCPDGAYVDILIGVDPAHGIWGLAPEPGRIAARLYVLDDDGSPLVIEADDVPAGSDYGDGDDWLDAAEAVIATFDFAD